MFVSTINCRRGCGAVASVAAPTEDAALRRSIAEILAHDKACATADRPVTVDDLRRAWAEKMGRPVER